MSQIIKPIMLDETGQVTNQKLTDLGTKIDNQKTEMSTQISGLGTKIDQHKTGVTSQLSTIGTKIDQHKTSIANQMSTVGLKIDGHKTETSDQLDNLADKINAHKTETSAQIAGIGSKLTAVSESLDTIAEAIEAVHSVNGQTGDVIIDATSVKVNRQTNAKTIAQVLSEEQSSVNDAVSAMQQAISRTPVSFSTSVIEDSDYLLTVALGTP